MAAKQKQLYDKALAFHQQGNMSEAQNAYIELIAAFPDFAPAWVNLATIRRRQGFPKAAIALNLRAMELDEDYRRIGPNLMNALRSDNRGHVALDLSLVDPKHLFDDTPVDARWRGLVSLDLGRPREAMALLKAALKVNPNDHDLRTDYGMALLRAGHYREGFDELESRFKIGRQLPDNRVGKRWNGADLKGETVTIVHEQGLGDMILLSRFIPEIRKMGPKKLIGEVAAPLVRLFESMEVFDIVVPQHSPAAPDETIWINAFDLARYLMRDAQPVVASAPINLPTATKRRASAIVAPYSARYKIGIVWTSKRTAFGVERKSVELNAFLQFAEVPGIQLFSLHRDGEQSEVSARALDGLIVDVGNDDADLADTAAVINALDLVVTVDTAVAHLAGALGKPVWLLAAEPAFWYWCGVGENTQFYPSMRVIRQSIPDNWDDVFRRVANDLSRMLR